MGRTARLGQRGDALLCLLPSERPYLDHLRQHGVALQQQPLPSLLSKLPVLANEGEQRTNAAKVGALARCADQAGAMAS